MSSKGAVLGSDIDTGRSGRSLVSTGEGGVPRASIYILCKGKSAGLGRSCGGCELASEGKVGALSADTTWCSRSLISVCESAVVTVSISTVGLDAGKGGTISSSSGSSGTSSLLTLS